MKSKSFKFNVRLYNLWFTPSGDMFYWIAVVLSAILSLQSLYLLTLTYRCENKFKLILTISFITSTIILVAVTVPIQFLYFLLMASVLIIGNWIFLTVYCYRRPTCKLRAYEFSIVSYIAMFLLLVPTPFVFVSALLIMSAFGLYLASVSQSSAAEEFAVGITTRERKNPFYLRWIKKVEYEEIYITPSLSGNKNVEQVVELHRKGCMAFAIAHVFGILEIIAFFIQLPNLSLCTDIARLISYQAVAYFAIRIVQ